MDKRGISEFESITTYDLKAYVRFKQQAGSEPQSIVSMFKLIKAFFSWCEKEGYLKEKHSKESGDSKDSQEGFKGIYCKGNSRNHRYFLIQKFY